MSSRTRIILAIISLIGILGVPIITNWNNIFHKNSSPPYGTQQSKLSPLVTPRKSANAASLPVTETNYGENIIADKEQSEWYYKNSDTVFFSYRFLNSSGFKLSCVVEFKSGYCKNETNCRTDIGNIYWTERDSKQFPLIIDAYGSSKLIGEMLQFPESVSDNCILTWRIINAQKLYLN